MRWSGLVPLVLLAAPSAAEAELNRCIRVDLEPQARADLPAAMSRGSQIVAWVEDASGTYVDTAFITAATGSFGIGNRPGRPDFNSGPAWPYGRREMVFPVWAHRHGLSFPEVIYQNALPTCIDGCDPMETNLSHPFNESSREAHFCRPAMPGDAVWDTGSCASTVFTDKGVFSPDATSLYPPRQDIARQPGLDSSSVEMYNTLNPFDAVSQATPRDGELAGLAWAVPHELPVGAYVMWVEVSHEFDHNATYSADARPSPTGIPWMDYGAPFRGQPSVLYRVPFTVAETRTTAQTLDYAGYGDPDGLDGEVRAPDGTITTDVPGSGAGRLAVVSDGGSPFRVRVTAVPSAGQVPPGALADLDVDHTTSSKATLVFSTPSTGSSVVRGYEVRYRVGADVTEENFLDSILAQPVIEMGDLNTLTLEKLLPETTYSVGIRAFDDCHNTGPVTTIRFTTQPRATGTVDACFVATAAYGSALANDVEMLRRFRDLALQRSVLGELAVESYYTFSPPVAGMVGESEVLRATARAVLSPVVERVRRLHVTSRM